ncbi:hypothetical protein AB990_01425 [Alkalihalobacillus pseudalcaliphilus]|nr:hypothetical protein AB990_01425 [Alkalihalobacillus pseudalcaliphilus]
MQLVIIPVITIGFGVLVAFLFKKVYLAPLVTLLINALIEMSLGFIYYGHFSLSSLSAWNFLFPVISLAIALPLNNRV